MYLYLIEWGNMSRGKPPFKWQVKKREYVWANDKEAVRKWATTQDKSVAVRTEELFAALKVPEMDIYTISMGAKI